MSTGATFAIARGVTSVTAILLSSLCSGDEAPTTWTAAFDSHGTRRFKRFPGAAISRHAPSYQNLAQLTGPSRRRARLFTADAAFAQRRLCLTCHPKSPIGRSRHERILGTSSTNCTRGLCTKALRQRFPHRSSPRISRSLKRFASTASSRRSLIGS
jgi:hypothetical protein